MAIETEVSVVVTYPLWETTLPKFEEIAIRAVQAALLKRFTGSAAEVSVLLTSDVKIAELNKIYRGISAPTNVLSFSQNTLPVTTPHIPQLIGDIAIALETVTQEAQAQEKTLVAHFTHLVVHGALHLLGYDHQTDEEALRMEASERNILATLGIVDPYAVDIPDLSTLS